jgi:hypothetical protein
VRARFHCAQVVQQRDRLPFGLRHDHSHSRVRAHQDELLDRKVPRPPAFGMPPDRPGTGASSRTRAGRRSPTAARHALVGRRTRWGRTSARTFRPAPSVAARTDRVTPQWRWRRRRPNTPSAARRTTRQPAPRGLSSPACTKPTAEWRRRVPVTQVAGFRPHTREPLSPVSAKEPLSFIDSLTRSSVAGRCRVAFLTPMA